MTKKELNHIVDIVVQGLNAYERGLLTLYLFDNKLIRYEYSPILVLLRNRLLNKIQKAYKNEKSRNLKNSSGLL